MVLIITSFFSYAQKRDIGQLQKYELGGSLGATNYSGELARKYNLLNNRPGGALFFRYNVNPSFVLRLNALYGQLQSSDNKFNEPLPNSRDLAFSSHIFEGAALMEYNFFNYRSEKGKQNWTPYLYGGVAYYGLINQIAVSNSNSNGSGLSIPFGMGLKFNSKKHITGWNYGFEFGLRKTFSDKIDGLSEEFDVSGSIQRANPDNNDVYYFTGVFISYTFIKLVCPRNHSLRN